MEVTAEAYMDFSSWICLSRKKINKKAQTREHVQQMPPRFKIQMWASDWAELNYTCKCRFEKSATVAVTFLFTTVKADVMFAVMDHL